MKRFLLVILLAPLFLFCDAQLIAFPGAEGFGKYASGGRGTPATAPKVFEVTKLEDDGTAGTFRYACTNNSPAAPNRIIVFRVAGTIHLTSAISMNRANTTVAGQTAPGGGICIADYPVTINANNIIVRYIRFRLGDKNQAATLGNDDAFGDNGSGRLKLIIDHCTMSWSNDEALTVYKGDSVTLQWNFITEPLDYSYHNEGSVQQHAYGGIESGKHMSIHHNLYAHIRGRMPRFDGIRNSTADTVDYRNNVLYNWADYTVNGGEGGAYNLVNNYYKSGLNSPTGSTSGVIKKAMIANPYKSTSPVIPYGKFFVTGNYVDGYPTVTNRNWLGMAMNGGAITDTVLSKSDDPINISVGLPVQTAIESYNAVLAGAGASLPMRDTLDERIVRNVTEGTGRLINTQGNYPGFPGYTPYATSQSAWPVLAAGFAPADSDHDGMPDIWETRRGLNPLSNADMNAYTASTGYSNLETYLNGDTIVAPGILNSCVSTKTFVSFNSQSWVYARDTAYSYFNSPSYLAAADSNNIAAAVLDNGSFGAFDVSYYTTNTIRTDAVTGKPYLNRNISITPQNPALITAPVTVRIYFSKKEFDDLKAADPSINTVADLNILKVSGSNCSADLSAGYTVISPTASGIFGSYGNGCYLEFQTSSFSTFYVGAKLNFVVPLTVVAFKATLKNKAADVTWKTGNEINTAFFTVEKSADALRFNPAGKVNAFSIAGDHLYSFTDGTPFRGISYYRLKTTDRDGKFSYSNIDKIINNSAGEISFYPDPVKDRLTVNHLPAGAHAIIKIINSDGALRMKTVVAKGAATTVIAVSSLPAGTYTLVFDDGEGNSTSKMFISIH